MNFWPYIIIVLMLMLSAFFSGSEIAFNSANKLRLKRAAEAGSKTADLAYRIIDKFTVALSAILIGNNLANIAVSTCTTLIIMDLFPEHVGVASTVATIVVTIVILICGEIVPKSLAKQHADGVSRVVAIPTRILTLLLSPIVAIVMILLFLLRKLWGKDFVEGQGFRGGRAHRDRGGADLHHRNGRGGGRHQRGAKRAVAIRIGV